MYHTSVRFCFAHLSHNISVARSWATLKDDQIFFLNLQKARDGKWDGKEFICRRCQSQPDKSSLLGHSGGWHNPWPNVCRRCWGLSDKEPNKNEPVPVKSTCQPIKAKWENDIPRCTGRNSETKLKSQYVEIQGKNRFDVRTPELVSKVQNPGGFLGKYGFYDRFVFGLFSCYVNIFAPIYMKFY